MVFAQEDVFFFLFKPAINMFLPVLGILLPGLPVLVRGLLGMAAPVFGYEINERELNFVIFMHFGNSCVLFSFYH